MSARYTSGGSCFATEVKLKWMPALDDVTVKLGTEKSIRETYGLDDVDAWAKEQLRIMMQGSELTMN